MARNDIGSKYAATKDLSPVEIAKLIRADIKTAIAKHELPPVKISLRTKNYNSITIHVVTIPDTTIMYNPARLEADRLSDWQEAHRENIHTPAASDILKNIEKIANEYNFDKSEIETDYFHVRFYCSVSFDWELATNRRTEETKPEVLARNLESLLVARRHIWEANHKKYLAEVAAEAKAKEVELAKKAETIAIDIETVGPSNFDKRVISIISGKKALVDQMLSDTKPTEQTTLLDRPIAQWLLGSKPNMQPLLVRHGNPKIAEAAKVFAPKIPDILDTVLPPAVIKSPMFKCEECTDKGSILPTCNTCAGEGETLLANNQRFLDRPLSSLKLKESDLRSELTESQARIARIQAELTAAQKQTSACTARKQQSLQVPLAERPTTGDRFQLLEID